MAIKYTVGYLKLYKINSSVQIKFLAGRKPREGTFSHHNKDPGNPGEAVKREEVVPLALQ